MTAFSSGGSGSVAKAAARVAFACGVFSESVTITMPKAWPVLASALNLQLGWGA